jgi:CarD family transcriptional regulator
MFKLNDKVVYPGHGVAVIDEIIEKKVAGVTVAFFKLHFLYKDMTILLPIGNFENTGVRYPGSQKGVEEVIGELHKFPKRKTDYIDSTPSAWNKRNKEYQHKIQEGKLIEIARIYRDLMYVSKQKELSFGEKNLLHTVEELLVQEIQLITKKDKDSVIQDIKDPFKQFFFHSVGRHGQVSSVT